MMLLDAENSASVGNYTKPVKAQIRMKGECFKEGVTTVTRKDILRETARSEIWRVIQVKAEKAQGAARRAEKQNIGDQLPEEALLAHLVGLIG